MLIPNSIPDSILTDVVTHFHIIISTVEARRRDAWQKSRADWTASGIGAFLQRSVVIGSISPLSTLIGWGFFWQMLFRNVRIRYSPRYSLILTFAPATLLPP
jgi:hypothetical protein